MDQKQIGQLLDIILKEMNKPPIFEYVTLGVSVIAIIISVIAIIYQVKLNNANLQSVYFEEIFGEYLKKKIPKAMESLDFDENGKLCRKYREINKVLMAMIRECGYFKYAKNDFYTDLITRTQELDEHLVDLAGRIVKDREQQDKLKISIHEEVQSIVKLINKNYQKF